MALHAWVYRHLAPPGEPLVPTSPRREDIARVARAEAAAAEGALAPFRGRYPQVRAEVRAVNGGAAHALVEASEAADVVVVAVHRRRGLAGDAAGPGGALPAPPRPLPGAGGAGPARRRTRRGPRRGPRRGGNDMTVLVGYASAHGSTREIAERIAARLAERGVEAETASLDAVGDAGGYDAYVLGSAVHGMAWLPEATGFVHTHRELLVSTYRCGSSASACPRPCAARGNRWRPRRSRR
ncbi:flavodoxin domain-containing protein [Streptomyces radiopugnans]|nr:flavodoxin domain-containing protein [Streptomyces radiopugnans]